MTGLKIVALGSSFAAGPNIEPYTNEKARRSSRNYANLLSQQLGADLVDLTVSGATLRNVVDTPQTMYSETFPPQLSLLPADADVVLLTGGGNDLGYSFGMTIDSMTAYLPSVVQSLLTKFQSSPVPPLTISKLTGRFTDVIDQVHLKAPSVTVYLVEYVSVFGSSTRPGADTPLDKSHLQRYDELNHMLIEAYKRAAAARPAAVLVEIADHSKDHEIGSASPWVDGWDLWATITKGFVPYHPNAACHQAIAAVLYQKLQGRVPSALSHKTQAGGRSIA